MNSPNPEITSQGIRLIGTAQRIRRIAKISIANPEQTLPLAKLALEPHALGNPELAMMHRSICLPLFPAVSKFAGPPFETDRGEKQIVRD